MRHPTVKTAVLSAALLAAGALVPAHAQSDGLSAAQAERYQALVTELRCLVCQNQSIADSNAPLAADLREQVRNQILAGRSDTQIHDYEALAVDRRRRLRRRPPFRETQRDRQCGRKQQERPEPQQPRRRLERRTVQHEIAVAFGHVVVDLRVAAPGENLGACAVRRT